MEEDITPCGQLSAIYELQASIRIGVAWSDLGDVFFLGEPVRKVTD